ncbi:MAG TPA: L-threonylcarbamoyladenylate synthase [Cytophagaceae bacterium]
MLEEINKTVAALKEGKVILYPTDTIWGLGCLATNEEAVRKLLQVKNRPDDKGLIIIISRIEQLYDYVNKIPEIAWDIVEFAEKPLTVVYPGGRNVAAPVLGADGSIAIRLVKDEFCKKLIDKLGKALVSTSANISGEPSPNDYSQVSDAIKERVDYIVNWRQGEKSSRSVASTIMRIDLDGTVKFIRK